MVGAFAGGVGAAPGAAAGATMGAEVGLAMLTWLGLGMLVVYVGTKLGQVGERVGRGVAQAWAAGGKPPQVREREVDLAAREMARGVGVLFRLILEGIVAYVLAKGMTAAMGALSKTILGARFAAWVEANWTSLRDNPRLNRNARGGGRPGDEALDAAPKPKPDDAPPQPPQPPANPSPNVRNTPSVEMDKQGKHIPGHKNYIPGKSTLTEDPAMLAQKAGTGQQVANTPVGQPGSKERVNFGKPIGTYIDPSTGQCVPTSNAIIHYSKKGIHIVPARP